ncbi:PAS domain S-box-containing protein [Nannocystis exedens]|uniref:histidine kinase n=1 Tax=Nannocystis exedens TaxID=54 RepID=A0A1I1U9H5_9BACT|nr:protoglobin domain-containing protein [Nannocystis exedens]PCC71533.1 histidine kinase [Nannocystis exedens]SFD67502.1 PAS domain S-box-containing protein [Nannocystis exedens]
MVIFTRIQRERRFPLPSHGLPARDPPAAETRFEELKRYVAFAGEDAALLRSFRDVAAPHFARIAQEFYDRIRQHDEAHAVFTGEAQIARLQRSLVLWMERLFGGRYDEAYFEDTAQIGRVHVKVGLPQRYMFTAMALIRSSLLKIAEAAGPSGLAVMDAISRLLDLELAIMLESYRDNFVARIQQVERLERQALGASLARTEHRYVNAVELAHVIIVGLDAQGSILLFNQEAERITGFARDEVIGRSLLDCLAIDETGEGAALREILRRFAAAQGQASEREVVSRAIETAVSTRSGQRRSVLWQLTHAPSSGDDVCVFAIGRDTTDEKALLARTKQQEKLAAVGTLAAGLAHEIRNPLNGAQLHVTYLDRSLKKSGAHPELIETVGVVADEIKRLGSLVTEFLAFARPKPLLLKRVMVQTLLERAAQMVAAQAHQHGVTVVLDVPPQPIEIEADGAKLEQVLLNLTQNAIEAVAAEARAGRVVLRARRQPQTASFEIEDDGPGIPADAPIFDAFFSTKPQGTGLGLSISYRIVTDHGGTLDVDSKRGCTIFRIVLPLDGPPDSASRSRVEAS